MTVFPSFFRTTEIATVLSVAYASRQRMTRWPFALFLPYRCNFIIFLCSQVEFLTLLVPLLACQACFSFRLRQPLTFFPLPPSPSRRTSMHEVCRSTSPFTQSNLRWPAWGFGTLGLAAATFPSDLDAIRNAGPGYRFLADSSLGRLVEGR